MAANLKIFVRICALIWCLAQSLRAFSHTMVLYRVWRFQSRVDGQQECVLEQHKVIEGVTTAVASANLTLNKNLVRSTKIAK